MPGRWEKMGNQKNGESGEDRNVLRWQDPIQFMVGGVNKVKV